MADLPRILARPDLPTVNLPRDNAAGARMAFGGLQEAAGDWAKVLFAKEKEAPVDAALLSSELNIRAEQWKNEAQTEDADPATWINSFRNKYTQGQAELLADTKDPRVTKFVQLHAARALDEHVKDLSKRAVETVHGQTVAKAQTAGELYAQHAASTTSQVLKDMDKQNFEALVRTAESPTRIGNQIFPPAWVKGEGTKARETYNERVEKLTAYNKIEANPQGLLDELKNPGNFQYLTGPEQNALKNHAEEALNRRQRLAKEEKDEKRDTRNTQLLAKNVDGTLTVGEVLSDPTLNFQDKKFWENKLVQEAKADVREARAEKREDRADARAARLESPFQQSDGATRARVMNGVFTKPHEWPPDKILALAGNGLSNADAHQLIKDQEALVKDKTGAASKKYDPLNRAMTTLEGLRRNYMFTKEGQTGAQSNLFSADVKKPTDANASTALRMKNDEEYGKVVDRVRAAAEQGQDPQAALQEAMKPYFGEKTKGYFEAMSQWFTSPRTSEVISAEKKQVESLNKLDAASDRYKAALQQTNPDEAARQFLLENNKVITPDTLKRAKDYLKSKGK